MSTVKVDTIKTTGNVEVYTCKAWVNFDGKQTAGNMIRGSGNVSSITDNGTGTYTVNFTNAMEDANYSLAHMCNAASLTSGQPSGVSVRSPYSSSTLDSEAMTTTSFRINAGFGNASGLYDVSIISIAVFR